VGIYCIVNILKIINNFLQTLIVWFGMLLVNSRFQNKYSMKQRVMKLAVMTSVVTTLLAANANAQTNSTNATKPPVTFSIKGGYNAANISVHNDGSVNDSKALSTFNAGVGVDIPVASILSVQTGLMLNGQGAKTNTIVDDENYVKTKFNPLYLQLPVSLVAKIPVSSNARFFVGAGPYAEMGIGGKSKTETAVLGVTSSTSEKIKFDNDDPTTDEEEGAGFNKLKRFDLGINALAGVEVDRFTIGVNYGLGLTDIHSTQNSSDNNKNKYRTFSVGVGFRL
jgi:hypothetical protein